MGQSFACAEEDIILRLDQPKERYPVVINLDHDGSEDDNWEESDGYDDGDQSNNLYNNYNEAPTRRKAIND